MQLCNVITVLVLRHMPSTAIPQGCREMLLKIGMGISPNVDIVVSFSARASSASESCYTLRRLSCSGEP